MLWLERWLGFGVLKLGFEVLVVRAARVSSGRGRGEVNLPLGRV